MKAKLLMVVLLFLLPGFLFAVGAQEKVEITGPVTVEFWHAMGGARIELIQGIVDSFMKENPDITVPLWTISPNGRRSTGMPFSLR